MNPADVEALPYQAVFNAIADAAKVGGGSGKAVEVSVAAFKASLITALRTQAPMPGEWEKEWSDLARYTRDHEDVLLNGEISRMYRLFQILQREVERLTTQNNALHDAYYSKTHHLSYAVLREQLTAAQRVKGEAVMAIRMARLEAGSQGPCGGCTTIHKQLGAFLAQHGGDT